MNENFKIAIQAALKAGDEIMKVYNTSFNVEYKDDRSPLTLADKNANQVINSYLNTTNIPIISEENKEIPYSQRKKWSSCWIVDPVDGTKEFVKRNGEFTVNIALVKEGIPVFGVIYVPVEKVLYIGDSGIKKSFKVIAESSGETIDKLLENAKEILPKQEIDGKVEVVGSRSHMNGTTLAFIENLKKKGKKIEIVSKGSSLKFCLVAEGNANVYPRFAPTMEWDTAAGQAICNAVGLGVISRETNESLKYNKENLLNPWFVVS